MARRESYLGILCLWMGEYGEGAGIGSGCRRPVRELVPCQFVGYTQTGDDRQCGTEPPENANGEAGMVTVHKRGELKDGAEYDGDAGETGCLGETNG